MGKDVKWIITGVIDQTKASFIPLLNQQSGQNAGQCCQTVIDDNDLTRIRIFSDKAFSNNKVTKVVEMYLLVYSGIKDQKYTNSCLYWCMKTCQQVPQLFQPLHLYGQFVPTL